MSKILVAYFSASGTTAKVAEMLAKAANADIASAFASRSMTDSFSRASPSASDTSFLHLSIKE